MKHPLQDISIFKIYMPESNPIITTAYSKSGMTVNAWKGFIDKPIAKATGYGYDKTHTALENAIRKMLSPELEKKFKGDGGCGFESVRKAFSELGPSYDIQIMI